MFRRVPIALMWTLVLVIVLAAAPGAMAEGPGEANSPAIARAVDYLRIRQAADGGLGNAGTTCDVAFALASIGQHPAAWRPTPAGPSIVDYLAANAPSYTTVAAQTGKLVAAVAAAGMDPQDFGGQDLLAHLESFHGEGTGYGQSATDQAWALLALLAAGRPVPEVELAILRAYQQENGGWEAGPGWGTDTNTTALVIQVLVAAGEEADSDALQAAREHLLGQQNNDGGFPYTKPSPWGTDSDANSTAYVIQALLALGEDPAAEPWAREGGDPVEALLRFQTEDGAFEWQPGFGANLLATAQAIPPLAGKALPLATPEGSPEAVFPAGPAGAGPAWSQGNLVACVPADGWVKAYRLTADGTWLDVNPHGWSSLRADGWLKVDGLPVDRATFGGLGNPYLIELWAGGERVRTVGLFHQGQSAFRIRPGADNFTPWACPAP